DVGAHGAEPAAHVGISLTETYRDRGEVTLGPWHGQALRQVGHPEQDARRPYEVLEPQVVVLPVRVEPDERVAVTQGPDDHGAHHCAADPAADEGLVEVAPARRDEIHEHLARLCVGHRSLPPSSV